jgi:hypothetical protein
MKDKLIEKQKAYIEKSKMYERFLLMPLQLRTDEWLVKGCTISNELDDLNAEIAALEKQAEEQIDVSHVHSFQEGVCVDCGYIFGLEDNNF